MSNKELIELLKHCSPEIIYIVDQKNRIIELKTPFKLKVLRGIGSLQKGELVSCTRLKITNKGRIVFHVDGKNYHTYYFDVVLREDNGRRT